MLTRIIFKALIVRNRRLLVAATAMLLAATLVTALVTVSLQMGSKAARELESYGANLLLLPKTVSLPAGTGGLAFGQVETEASILEQSLSLIESGAVKGIKSYAPYIYTIASKQGQKVVVTGTFFDKVKEINPYWQIRGGWVEDNSNTNSIIIGKNVSQSFDLHPGDEFSLEFKGTRQSFIVAGIAEVGGSEDNQIFIPLKAAQAFSGRAGQLDLVQIRAFTEEYPLSMIASELEKVIPDAEARVIGQIAEAEKSVLFKIQLLISLITVLVLLVAAVAVFSTVSASILERTREIGLMKALGARSTHITLIFLSEAFAIGMFAGILGNVSGLGLAQAISRSVFNTYLTPQAITIPVTITVSILVATIASLWPVYRAMNVQPIIALRGE